MTPFENVIANPSSLRCRRNLANFWQEIAHPQGQLLSRVVAERDGLGRFEAKAVRGEMRELIASHGAEWAGRIAELTIDYTYELGMISSCSVTGEMMVKHGAELFSLAPIISLGINTPLCINDVLRMPQLKQLRELYIGSGEFDDGSAALVADCESLSSVIAGAIYCKNLTRVGLQALLNNRHWDGLVAMELYAADHLMETIPSGRLTIMQHEQSWYMQNSHAAGPYWDAAVAEAAQSYSIETISWPPILDDLYWSE